MTRFLMLIILLFIPATTIAEDLLIETMKDEQIDSITQLINDGANPNARDEDG